MIIQNRQGGVYIYDKEQIERKKQYKIANPAVE